jgi:hypothetical protein
MMHFLRWLFFASERPVANWTPQRASYYEKQTLKILGRGETAYEWSGQFAKKRTPSADVLKPTWKTGT